MNYDRSIFDALLRQNFYAFVRKVFDTLHAEANQEFVPAWHIEAMCYQLEQAARALLPLLLISVPPRHLKSIAAAVALPAWVLGHHPAKRIMVATYGADLASQHSSHLRQILESDWYQQLFPNTQTSRTLNRQLEIGTTRGGGYKAVTPGGPSTGFGCDLLIIDDLMKAADARSEVERERVQHFYRTLVTRFNDPGSGAVISIQQRLHEDDLPGYLLEQGGFRHLELKAIAETDECHPLYFDRVAERSAGDVLWPERFPKEELERLRRELGSADFAAQYQQSPTAPEGNVVRWDWFHTNDENFERKDFVWVVQSWDTAATAEPTSDYSACTTWGFRRNKWYLLNVWRGRLEYPALRRWIVEHARRWRADKIVVEYMGTGQSLIQELRRKDGLKAMGLRPNGDKVDRMIGQTGKIESGDVLIPAQADWLDDFRAEIRAFPNGRYDDQVDSVSQFLRFLDTPAGRALLNKDPVTGRRLPGRRRPHRRAR